VLLLDQLKEALKTVGPVKGQKKQWVTTKNNGGETKKRGEKRKMRLRHDQ
jgi:hypothetical protein